jgi:hypothetical protein
MENGIMLVDLLIQKYSERFGGNMNKVISKVVAFICLTVLLAVAYSLFEAILGPLQGSRYLGYLAWGMVLSKIVARYF